MDLHLDPDVQRVAEFIQREIVADRTVTVAQRVAALAPLLWGADRPLTLREPPLS